MKRNNKPVKSSKSKSTLKKRAPSQKSKLNTKTLQELSQRLEVLQVGIERYVKEANECLEFYHSRWIDLKTWQEGADSKVDALWNERTSKTQSKQLASLLGKPLNAISGRITDLKIAGEVVATNDKRDGCAVLRIRHV